MTTITICIIAWSADLRKKYWSFQYFPEQNEAVRMFLEYKDSGNGILNMRYSMENHSNLQREWQISIYISPTHCLDLPNVKVSSFNQESGSFQLLSNTFFLISNGLKIKSVVPIDSSFWINFPFNVEQASSADTPLSREKLRLQLTTEPVLLQENRTKKGNLTISVNRTPPRTIVVWPNTIKRTQKDTKQLCYDHLWWETIHNQQYVRSYNGRNMTARIIPSRQWGRFFLWDTGMTLVGAIERDCEFVEKQLTEMPDPANEKFEGVRNSLGSFIPTAVLAMWELYALTEDVGVLERHYHRMLRLFNEYYNKGTGYGKLRKTGVLSAHNNLNGIDDHPANVYCDGWPFAWDYKSTLPVNDNRELRRGYQPGLTALAIRFAKTLRMAAYVLGNADDMAHLTKLIEKSEQALNEYLWDNKNKIYAWRTDEDGKLPMFGLDGCYPLLSCSVPEGRKQKLWQHVKNKKGMYTQYGLTVVPMNSEYYREDGYWNGAIWIPPQWFIWKACYNDGKMLLAHQIADNVLRLWEKNHTETLCCWENFRVNTGKGAGNSRFSGLNTALLSLASARMCPGRVQYGQDVLVKHKIARDLSFFEAHIYSPFSAIKTGLSVVLRPQTTYKVELPEKRSQN